MRCARCWETDHDFRSCPYPLEVGSRKRKVALGIIPTDPEPDAIDSVPRRRRGSAPSPSPSAIGVEQRGVADQPPGAKAKRQQIAPRGKCPYCDVRREILHEQVRKHRQRKTRPAADKTCP